MSAPPTYGIVQPGADTYGGVPMLRAGDLHAGTPAIGSLIRVAPEIEQRFARTRIVGGEVLISLVGTPGVARVADKAWRGFNVARAIGVLRVDPADARWVSYCFETEVVKAQVAESLNTTVQATLNLQDLARVQIPMPEARIRDGVCQVLGALDDKIAANRHLAGCICDLQTELWRAAAGRVPKVSLTSVAVPHLGGTPPRGDTSAWGGSVCWASVRDVTSSECGVILETAETIDEEVSRSARRLNPLPKGSVILTARGTVGSVAVLGVECAINQSAYAFVPSDGRSTVLRCAIEAAVDELRSKAHGSVFSTITMQTLNEIRVPNLFGGDASSLAARLETLEERRRFALIENGVLVRTRDELLPQLMDGRIRVKEAEKRVEDIV